MEEVPSSPGRALPPEPNSARLNETLSFVAGNQTGHISAQDSDVFSWLLMNSDLFPQPHRGRVRGDSETSRFPTRLRGDSGSNLPLPLAATIKPTAAESVLGVGGGGSMMGVVDATTLVGTGVDEGAAAGGETSAAYDAYGWDNGEETEDSGEHGKGDSRKEVSSDGARSSGSGSSSSDIGFSSVGASRRSPQAKAAGINKAKGGKGAKAGKGSKGKGKATKKSPSSSGDAKILSKREARLEKNREIARNCRKRKREKFEMMEEELTRLRAENEELRRKLDIGSHNSDRRELVRRAKMMELERMLEKGSGATEEKIGASLKDYKECFADNGRERIESINYHLDQLKMLLLPTQVTKMCLWSLNQNKDFYDSTQNHKTFGGSVWSILCQTMQLSKAQEQFLISRRFSIASQRRNLAAVLEMLEKLREKVSANSRVLEGNMDAIMSALRPSQQAKFLVWIENNQTCMMMLNSLWGQLEDQHAARTATAPVGSTAGGVNGVPVIGRSMSSSGHRGYGAFVPAKYDLTCGALGVGPLEDVGAPERINGFTGEKLSVSTTDAGANSAAAAAAASVASAGAAVGLAGGGQERGVASEARPSKRARR